MVALEIALTRARGLPIMDNRALCEDLPIPGEELDLLSPVLAAHSITSVRPLTEGDARRSCATGAALVPQKTIKSMRQSHHRAAQMIAAGASNGAVSRFTAYTPGHISDLRSDPAFQELVAYYQTEGSVFEQASFEELTADLSTDLMAELRQRLDEEPERIGTTTLLDAIKTVSDRAGRAPVSRSVNANFNIGIGERMRRAQTRLLPANLTRALPGVSNGVE
jgi:hypothetical protein